MKLNVIWDSHARIHLSEAYKYIRKDSIDNAEKVRKKILAATDTLSVHPKKYPADKYKINNDGSYRAFIVYRYRISYKIQDTEIRILRIRHTSMEPLEY
jgi:plasmid stabilization system protein ParE